MRLSGEIVRKKAEGKTWETPIFKKLEAQPI